MLRPPMMPQMKNNYPTFPNPAGIGSGIPYESMAPQLPAPTIVEPEMGAEEMPVGLGVEAPVELPSTWGAIGLE